MMLDEDPKDRESDSYVAFKHGRLDIWLLRAIVGLVIFFAAFLAFVKWGMA